MQLRPEPSLLVVFIYVFPRRVEFREWSANYVLRVAVAVESFTRFLVPRGDVLLVPTLYAVTRLANIVDSLV